MNATAGASHSASNENGRQLTSENTPYVVIPQDVAFPGLDKNNGGNIIAVVYNNQFEFRVFGDTGPTDIIGEASVRTANGLGMIRDRPVPETARTPPLEAIAERGKWA